jgi:uncharacterized membrane protein
MSSGEGCSWIIVRVQGTHGPCNGFCAFGNPIFHKQNRIILDMVNKKTSYHETNATNVGLIVSLSIIFTPILESLASRNWLPRSFFVATVVAVIGVALLVSDKGFATPSAGDWLLLGVAVIRSIHVTAMGHLTKGRSYSTIVITLIQSVICAFIFIICAGHETVEAISRFHLEQWWGLLYLGLIIGSTYAGQEIERKSRQNSLEI